MARLIPMTPADYEAFLERSIPEYAEDKVRVGNWAAEGALERSRAEFHNLLPEGPATPNNHLWMIEGSDSTTKVGVLWLAVQEHNGVTSGFVYDVLVFEPYRRQGHARSAFLDLENKASELGLASIGLHVFGDNHAARALYLKLGYAETNVNMRKML